jgi:hypothetical protein
MSTSRRFRTLTKSLDTLRLYFLPKQFSTLGKYTAREHDLARAYVLLVHAEIESYIEDRAKEIADRAETRWSKAGTHSRVIRRVVGSHHLRNQRPWEPFNKSAAAIRAALNSYDSLIHNNHGIKENNLRTLLFPIGIQYKDLNITWLVNLESFGNRRGLLAHNSIQMLQPVDPDTEFKKVRDILKGLRGLDRKISRLR